MSEVVQELTKLIDKAEAQGKWLWTRYQGIWFAPQELREALAQGRFRWGVANWEIRDPQEYVIGLERIIENAQRTLTEAQARIAASRR